ncbi:MAG TPA: DNA N-6-adenine-methyltransferase [Pyrinomonadaceae bacterium]|nr:DNA N-6-adenine-methyltransferase [Pyrinomonadaceae bacterium]
MTAFNNKLDEGSKTEWCTPVEIVRALGTFELDPCAPIIPPYKLAERTFNINDDGLSKEWGGARVFLNPPYDQNLYRWLGMMYANSNGIALIFARTDTKYFHDFVWTASAALFLSRRITFLHVDGSRAARNSGAPSVLVAYGDDNALALKQCGLQGKYLVLNKGLKARVEVAPGLAQSVLFG